MRSYAGISNRGPYVGVGFRHYGRAVAGLGPIGFMLLMFFIPVVMVGLLVAAIYRHTPYAKNRVARLNAEAEAIVAAEEAARAAAHAATIARLDAELDAQVAQISARYNETVRMAPLTARLADREAALGQFSGLPETHPKRQAIQAQVDAARLAAR